MNPRRTTPGARARRALLIDVIAAALLAAITLSLAAGLGVVAFFALPLLLIGLLWITLERLTNRLRHRRQRSA
ncbi:MAG TPA: hypothetical protein VGK66_01530 [Solirubrobacterales bacterium]|nr:hypothetical protein [Solirubrobacterales bacterium]